MFRAALALAPIVFMGAGMAAAQDGPVFRDAADADLDGFRWNARPVLVFADAENDPGYVSQMDILRDVEDGLADRDIVVMSDAGPGNSALRERFAPKGFLVVLIGKDGGVKLSRTEPVAANTLFDTIDAMPMRQREMRKE